MIFYVLQEDMKKLVKLAKIRDFDLIFVGKHGGNEKKAKLESKYRQNRGIIKKN